MMAKVRAGVLAVGLTLGRTGGARHPSFYARPGAWAAGAGGNGGARRGSSSDVAGDPSAVGPLCGGVSGAGCVASEGGVPPVQPGSFSVFDWTGYPSGVARPSGPFRLLQGAEYDAARKAASQANATLRRADPAKCAGKQIHEINPVKFGGSPTDPANKIALTPAEHAKYTTFWNRLMRGIQ